MEDRKAPRHRDFTTGVPIDELYIPAHRGITVNDGDELRDEKLADEVSVQGTGSYKLSHVPGKPQCVGKDNTCKAPPLTNGERCYMHQKQYDKSRDTDES